MSDVENKPASPFLQPGQQAQQPAPSAPALGEQGKEVTLADVLAKVDALRQEAPVPPAAKAQEAAKEQKAEPAESVDLLNTADIDTGSKALDIAVGSFLKAHKATQEDVRRATENAIAYGDPALIDEAFLRERFGDSAGEARAIAEAVIEQATAQRTALVNDIHSLAGGQQAWDAALSVYKQHATPGLQKVVKAMIDSGDASSVKEAAGLILGFSQNSGVMVKTGNRMTPNAQPSQSRGLSAAEFQKAMRELNPSSRSYRDTYNQLLEMRRVGKQLGK